MLIYLIFIKMGWYIYIYIYAIMKRMCCPGYHHKSYIMCPGELPQSLCGHNWEGTLFSWLHIYLAPISHLTVNTYIYIYIYIYICVCIYIFIYILSQYLIGKYVMQCCPDRAIYINALSWDFGLQTSFSSSFKLTYTSLTNLE